MAIWNGSATRLLGVGALGAGLALQVLTGPAVAWASDDTADGPSAAAAAEPKASEAPPKAAATEPAETKDVVEEPDSKTKTDPEAAADPDPQRIFLVAAQGDEVLDWREMVARHPSARRKLLAGSDHALSDFDDHIDEVLEFLDL